MNAADILLAAAALAEHQPSASRAINAALRFADRFPAAVAALSAAEQRKPYESLTLVLAAHYARPVAVAGAFRDAAGMVTA